LEAPRRLRPPPSVKVLEAAGAIGGGRVRLLESGPEAYRAVVRSSGRDLEYKVAVSPAGSRVVRAYSTDNGTVYRGYVGYPIIAVMMLAGMLPRSEAVERALAKVNWYEVNRRFKSYAKTMSYVLSMLGPEERAEAGRLVGSVAARLRELEVIYDPGLASGW
jgi:hypothetical protein